MFDAYITRTVRELLGHASVETTMISTHVSDQFGRAVALNLAQFHTSAGFTNRDSLRPGAGYPGTGQSGKKKIKPD